MGDHIVARPLRKRNLFLTLLLVPAIPVTAATGVLFIVMPSRFANTPEIRLQVFHTVFLGSLLLVDSAALVGLWLWRRWGLYLLGSVATIGFALNLSVLFVPWQGYTRSLQGACQGALEGLLLPAVLAGLVLYRWEDFE